MKSQKSESGSWKPRLRRTLSRNPKFHPIENEDVKWVWAAYKSGSLDRLIKEGIFEADLSPHEFDQAFKIFVLNSVDACWVMEAQTKKGFIPVGIAHGYWLFDALIFGDTLWFPWASRRNRVESLVKLLNELRKSQKLLGLVHPHDKEFFVYIAKHGIIRRVGTVYDFNPDGPMAMYQSRTPQWATS